MGFLNEFPNALNYDKIHLTQALMFI